VVGQEELDNHSVNVRNRDDVGTKAKTAMMPLDTIMDKLVKLKASRSLQNTLSEQIIHLGESVVTRILGSGWMSKEIAWACL
jgi:hypothetical protein